MCLYSVAPCQNYCRRSVSVGPQAVLYHRHGGYASRLRYPNPQEVNRLYGASFNRAVLLEILNNQQKQCPKPYSKIQTRPRDKPLWEPRVVSREKAERHAAVDIQNARLRKQARLDNISYGPEARQRQQRRDEVALRRAELMPHAAIAYLDKLENWGMKIESKIAERKKLEAMKRLAVKA